MTNDDDSVQTLLKKQDEQRIVQEERLNERILSLTSRVGYLGHVTGYQPIRDEYFLIRLVPDMCH